MTKTFEVVGGWHAEERNKMIACYAVSEEAALNKLKFALERAESLESTLDRPSNDYAKAEIKP